MLRPSVVSPVLALLLLYSCPTQKAAGAALPREVAINPEAGRGGPLVVTVQLESGEELPMVLDTGTSGTILDKSLLPKLGKPIGTMTTQSWGHKQTVRLYAAPKLFLGGVPLILSSPRIFTDDCQAWGSLGGRPTLGMLGIDCLGHYCIQLDFAAGKMRFLDDDGADKQKWGRAFPIVALNARDERPAVAENLLGVQGAHSLIDSGFTTDGWLMPRYFEQWTNLAVPAVAGQARFPNGLFGGERYLLMTLPKIDVESDGLGLRFLARHLATLDFPKHTLYLQRQSIGPLPDPRLARVPALEPLFLDVLEEDLAAARKALTNVEQSRATDLEKTVARKLVATLKNEPKPAPADVPSEVTQLPLGDAHPEQAEVGWLRPAANRIPLSEQMESPLLDSGKIYATGLFAHSPSRYVYDLGGKWKGLRGEAGLHTAFQGLAWGVVFVIKTDGKQVFRSPAIRDSAHPRYEIDLRGVKKLELRVEQAGTQNGCNWALWLDPTLYREPPKPADRGP